MEWLFALGVIGFSIYNPKFRKVVFWMAGILVILFALMVAFMNSQH